MAVDALLDGGMIIGLLALVTGVTDTVATPPLVVLACKLVTVVAGAEDTEEEGGGGFDTTEFPLRAVIRAGVAVDDKAAALLVTVTVGVCC